MPNVDDEPMPTSLSQAPAGVEALTRLGDIAEELGESATAADVRQLVTRISEGRFFVACIGQFKRGKSTLLDALVGEAILPTGVVPVTSVPTVLRYGSQRAARVLIASKWQTILPEELAQYVSEELNPENEKCVEGVEVFLPAPLLAHGMCLVDTPGIGSVFAGNTVTTTEFIPQIDAAILVVGADPPISGEELALMETVAANVDEVKVVLNKIDRVSPAEREQATAFAMRVLEGRLKRSVGRIYEVSALNRLKHAPGADDWDTLVNDLGRLAGKSGEAMTHAAAELGIRRTSSWLQRSVKERLCALQEPIANSEQRIGHLRQTASRAEESLRDLGALFSADQMRVSTALQLRRKAFLKQTIPQAGEEFERESHSVGVHAGPARRRELMALAQAIARRHVMPWLDTEEAQAEQLYLSVTQRFITLVNELLQRIATEQAGDFADLPKSVDEEQGFRTRSRFYFHDMITVAEPVSPLLYVADVVMGALHVQRWFLCDGLQFLERLLETNAARVQGDVEQRVVESRVRLESEVRRLLRDVSATAEHALSEARELMSAGSAAVNGEVDRLHRLRSELERLSGAL